MQPLIISRQLERFRAKWIPVCVKKTRQNKRLEPGSDSIRTDKARGEFRRNAGVAPALAGLSLLALASAGFLGGFLGTAGAHAQNIAKPAIEAAPQAVPGFWDPRRRPDRPDLSRLTVIRFLTETDYPPFNFTGPDGNPAGFNVDLARLICEEIKVTCTIQMRRFEPLIDAITSNRGDAIIASLAVTPQMRARLDFSDPYSRAPARFVSRRDSVMAEVRPEYLEGKKVGVIA